MALNITNSTRQPLNDSSFNFSAYLFYDLFDQCLDMDCIFSRTLITRLPVLRPLTAMLVVIGLLGFVGNVFVILVYSRTRKKRTSTYLILMLAITDLIACSLVIPGTLCKEWFFKFKSDFICKMWELLRNYVIISSAMTLSVIAFNRFLLVCRNRFEGDNKKVTTVMIMIIIVTGLSLGIPPMLGIGVYIEDYEEDDVHLVNIEVCLPNDILISEYSLDCYWQFLTALFGCVIVTINVLYLVIFIMVYKHSDHCKGQHSNQQTSTVTSLYNKSKRQSGSVLPAVCNSVPAQNQQKVRKLNFLSRKHRNHQTWSRFPKISHILKRRKVTQPNVNVQIISNTKSDDSTNNLDKDYNQPARLQPYSHRADDQQPSTSGTQHRSSHRSYTSTLKPTSTTQHTSTRISYTGSRSQRSTLQSDNPTTSNIATNHSRQSSQIKNTTAHVKTTQVLCIITTVYIVAFLPMFLIIHDVIEHREILFYLYFINNAANPVIYSFMNKRFRLNVWRFLLCKKNQIWPAW